MISQYQPNISPISTKYQANIRPLLSQYDPIWALNVTEWAPPCGQRTSLQTLFEQCYSEFIIGHLSKGRGDYKLLLAGSCLYVNVLQKEMPGCAFWSTSNLRIQGQHRETLWERSQGYGVDTVTINVSTANCICFNSITGINELYNFANKISQILVTINFRNL